MISPEQKRQMAAYRRKNFAVTVEQPKRPNFEEDILLSITFNGYQWQVLGFENLAELRQVKKAITDFLKTQKRPKAIK